MECSFVKRKSLLGKDENWGFWKEFKEKHPSYKNISNAELTRITHSFFKHAGELIVNSPHGVILNGLGYFSVTSFRKRKVMKAGDKLQFNFTDPNLYTVYFFPRILKTNPFNSWNFKVYKPLKAILKENIKNGVKYKCHNDILKKNSQGSKYYINDK